MLASLITPMHDQSAMNLFADLTDNNHSSPFPGIFFAFISALCVCVCVCVCVCGVCLCNIFLSFFLSLSLSPQRKPLRPSLKNPHSAHDYCCEELKQMIVPRLPLCFSPPFPVFIIISVSH
jgi:hypothetical protein